MYRVIYKGFTFNLYNSRVNAFIEFANNDNARYIKNPDGTLVPVAEVNDYFDVMEGVDIKSHIREDGTYYYTKL